MFDWYRESGRGWHRRQIEPPFPEVPQKVPGLHHTGEVGRKGSFDVCIRVVSRCFLGWGARFSSRSRGLELGSFDRCGSSGIRLLVVSGNFGSAGLAGLLTAATSWL